MAQSKLASAYKAAAGASAKHQASLYDVANIGYQREGSAQLAGIKARDLSTTVGMISEGLDLVGNIGRKRKRTTETRQAAEALGAKPVERSLWGKIMGEEQMWEKEGATVSGADIMNEFKLQQQEQAFGRDRDTGKVKETETKESPVIPEVKEEKKEPTLAEEANITDVTADPIYGPPAPNQGLDITSEQLEDWKSTSGYFDETSDKKALTQMANWQKAGKPKRDIATIGPSRTGGGLPVMNW